MANDDTPPVVEEATEVVEENSTENVPVPPPLADDKQEDDGNIPNRVGLLESLVNELADKVSALTQGDTHSVITDETPASKPWTHKGLFR